MVLILAAETFYTTKMSQINTGNLPVEQEHKNESRGEENTDIDYSLDNNENDGTKDKFLRFHPCTIILENELSQGNFK